MYWLAVPPNHRLAERILQYLHRARKLHALKKALIVKVNTRLWILTVLRGAHRGGVGRKPKLANALALSGREHRFDVWKALPVHRTDERRALLID